MTWTGANDSTNHNWDNPSNWTVTNSGTDTYPQAGDIANFNSSDTVNVDGAQAAASINFNSGASIILNQTNNGTLSLGNGLTAATSDTIAAPLALTGTDTVTASTGSILTISGTISGTGYGLTANGTGTLVLGSSNSYSGGTILSSGVLVVASTSGLGSSGAAVTLNGGTLDLATGSSVNAYNVTVGSNVTIASDLASRGAGITYTLGTLSIGANTLTVAGGANVTSGTAGLTFGATSFTGAPTFNITNPSAGTMVLTVGLVANGINTATFTGNGNFAQTGVWGNGAGGLILGASYNGTATLSQANTYSGSTTINGGVLSISADTNLGRYRAAPRPTAWSSTPARCWTRARLR